MKRKGMLIRLGIAVSVAVTAIAIHASQDKYSVQVPGGLAFSEFRGYESWQVINVSHHKDVLAAILGNPAMIEAYKAGIPDNGKPVPDGAKMAKIHWKARINKDAPGSPTVGGTQMDMDFMVKDSKRFADSGGWGYATFIYDAASNTFRPGDESDKPPQAHDAKCGYACHTEAQKRDYVFTSYGTR